MLDANGNVVSMIIHPFSTLVCMHFRFSCQNQIDEKSLMMDG